jgi:SAM-dependent methyltransferase
MKTAPRLQTASSLRARTQDAWTAFWQDPGQSRCVAGAPDIWTALTSHWSTFARGLAPGARVLDLGCGAGAVARLLVEAREDVRVTGVDFARVPLMLDPQVELLSETAMESLPFSEHCFDGAVSQFGYEYSELAAAADEMRRVSKPGAPLRFLVHHADSGIVATNRSRLGVLEGLLGAPLRASFCSGDAATFVAQLRTLQHRYPGDSLLAELARSLPSRLTRAQRERVAIWKAIEDALAPERCLAESLERSRVGPADLQEWLAPLRAACDLASPAVLRETGGTPIAWSLEGRVKS